MSGVDQKLLRQREAKCVQENPPGCTAACPVHVDVRGIVTAVRKGDYTAGFALLHRIIPFPGIISRICEQPCQQACKRNEVDEPVFVRALEKVCVDNNTSMPKMLLPLPKQQKVAVVGAGLSGLTAAVELARKGYQVTVFEAAALLGGSIRSFPGNTLPLSVIEADLAMLQKLPLTIRTAMPVTGLDSLYPEFDAIYLATGKQAAYLQLDLQLDAAGAIMVEPLSLATSNSKVFAGGSLRRAANAYSAIFSIADGKVAAISIDRLFQNASLTANRDTEGPYRSTLYTNITGVKPQPMVCAAAPDTGYTSEEAGAEAARCLVCQCLECVKVCEYLAHYRAYPKRYVREIYNNLSIVMGIHHANKMINSCSLCGLCEQVCPGKLNMGEVCQQARQIMVDKGKMPPSTHEFALQDMQFSNSDHCALARHQPGFTASAVVFYPGCQLAASSPQSVSQVYRFLCEKIAGGVGLMLGCCGAPAKWAGQEQEYQETLRVIGQTWQELGRPRIITACPSCYRLFKHHFPDMAAESLWTVLDRIGLPAGTEAAGIGQKLAIHDSCTTRDEAELQNSVRSIMAKLGLQAEELPLNRETTVCCGYGGLMIYANQEVAHKVIRRRIGESESDFLTYCVMCRDNFASQGKRAFYLLDVIFGHVHADQPGPGYSARQENRSRLKTTLLQEVWGEPGVAAQAKCQVTIPADVLRVMEERRILIDDVTRVIEHAETSGEKLKDPASGYYIAYFQPVNVTYWVEYLPQADGFVVKNAYCHRLVITS